MKIEFNVSTERITNFSEGAKTELIKQSKRIVEEIIDEANRIEAIRRISDTNSEITQSNVREAATQSRIFIVKKKDWLIRLLQVIAFISSLIAGSLLDTDKFKNTSHVIWFIVMLFIAIATTVYVIFNQDNNG